MLQTTVPKRDAAIFFTILKHSSGKECTTCTRTPRMHAHRQIGFDLDKSLKKKSYSVKPLHNKEEGERKEGLLHFYNTVLLHTDVQLRHIRW